MIVADIPVRVRYKETDNMGVVHHSNYINYYEVARTELLRGLGITYREMEARGVMLPVREVHIDYLAPARYDDLLTVRISMPEMPRVRMVFTHEIYTDSGKLVNRGSVTLVFVDAVTRRPCRAPRWFLDVLEPAFFGCAVEK